MVYSVRLSERDLYDDLVFKSRLSVYEYGHDPVPSIRQVGHSSCIPIQLEFREVVRIAFSHNNLFSLKALVHFQ